MCVCVCVTYIDNKNGSIIRGVARVFKIRGWQGGVRDEQGGGLTGTLKMAALHRTLYKV